jgi:antirestriction protein ArdC
MTTATPTRAARHARMAAPANRQRAVLARLEAAVAAIHDSETFRRYLDAQARFHTYSWRNVALILAQCPEATRVAGYRTWQALGRQVRRGEHGITILVPLPVKQVAATDDAAEATEPSTGLRFGTGTVFDVSQTEGEPLPAVAVPELHEERGAALYDALARLAQAEGLDLRRQAQLSDAQTMGVYNPGQRSIVVREAAQLQMTKTLAHELAHHFTGRHESYTARRHEHETIAEAVAYVVLAHVGLDSGSRSFPYIATWATETATLRTAMRTIHAVAHTIISRIDTFPIDNYAPVQS